MSAETLSAAGGTRRGYGGTIEYAGTGLDNTQYIATIIPGVNFKIKSIAVCYRTAAGADVNVTKTPTVVLDAAQGILYDRLLQSIPIVANPSGEWKPSEDDSHVGKLANEETNKIVITCPAGGVSDCYATVLAVVEAIP